MKNKKVVFKFLTIMVASSRGFIINGLINKNLRSFAEMKAKIHNNINMPRINNNNSHDMSQLYTEKTKPNSSTYIIKEKKKKKKKKFCKESKPKKIKV